MVPTWVLLKRKILFEHDASAFGGASEAGEESMRRARSGEVREGSTRRAGSGEVGEGSTRPARSGDVGEGSGARAAARRGGASRTVKVPTRRDMDEAILVYLQSLKPDAHFANPPELSSLRLLRPTESAPQLCGAVASAIIASTDKNLVALYAGPYLPGTDYKGGYLIYDASKNSLTAIPRNIIDYCAGSLGLGAVVLCLDEIKDDVLCFDASKDDTYLLCELTIAVGGSHPVATLSIWRPTVRHWLTKVMSLPAEVHPPNCFFRADMCFSYQGSFLCWVDLFKGMLICDSMIHSKKGYPKFRFIPLPQECMAYDRFEHPWRAEEFRTVACVGGSIKFVTMDGYGLSSATELSLAIWTLSTDLCGWNKVHEYFVRDIWASTAYLRSGLPTIVPLFPVLSMDEDDVVYLVITRRQLVDGVVEDLGQYLLTVDMQHNKVSYCPQNTVEIHSQLFASQCSAYLQRLEDHQGNLKKKCGGKQGLRVNLGYRVD